jgi:uncharacterized membrane protein YbaN (DUF454 family)
MILIKTILLILILMFVAFLWRASIDLTKPYYNHTYHVWEEDKAARQLSNLAIALMMIIMFFIGYIIG